MPKFPVDASKAHVVKAFERGAQVRARREDQFARSVVEARTRIERGEELKNKKPVFSKKTGFYFIFHPADYEKSVAAARPQNPSVREFGFPRSVHT